MFKEVTAYLSRPLQWVFNKSPSFSKGTQIALLALSLGLFGGLYYFRSLLGRVSIPPKLPEESDLSSKKPSDFFPEGVVTAFRGADQINGMQKIETPWNLGKENRTDEVELSVKYNIIAQHVVSKSPGAFLGIDEWGKPFISIRYNKKNNPTMKSLHMFIYSYKEKGTEVWYVNDKLFSEREEFIKSLVAKTDPKYEII